MCPIYRSVLVPTLAVLPLWMADTARRTRRLSTSDMNNTTATLPTGNGTARSGGAYANDSSRPIQCVSYARAGGD